MLYHVNSPYYRQFLTFTGSKKVQQKIGGAVDIKSTQDRGMARPLSSGPASSFGNVGNIALDFLILNNDFKKLAYFETKCLVPSVGRLPDINKSEENALSLPAEIYFNGKITILQIRSSLKENKIKAFIADLQKFIEENEFSFIFIIGSADRTSQPDSEISKTIPSVFHISHEKIDENFKFNFGEVINAETLDKNPLKEIFGGSSLIKKLKKNKTAKKIPPISCLFVYSSLGSDIFGSLLMVEKITKILSNYEIKDLVLDKTKNFVETSTYKIPKSLQI